MNRYPVRTRPGDEAGEEVVITSDLTPEQCEINRLRHIAERLEHEPFHERYDEPKGDEDEEC